MKLEVWAFTFPSLHLFVYKYKHPDKLNPRRLRKSFLFEGKQETDHRVAWGLCDRVG